MLDRVSLDQLRTFIAAVDEGSFSAAARRLKRAQSMVSQTLLNLEGQLGVRLFDRGGRFPVLTEQGRALLADARAVTGDIDLFNARAKSLAGELEPELSVAVDVMYPETTFADAVVAFEKAFPATLLRFDDESSTVVEPVLDGRCAVGIVASWWLAPPQLSYERLLLVRVPVVVSSQHPLASHRGLIATAELAKHVQIVHFNPTELSRNYGFGIRSARVWRLSHLGAKLAFLRAGFGFGGLPTHLIEADLASGALVPISVEGTPPDGHVIAMSAVYRTDSPPGPAGRWFIEHLKQKAAQGPTPKSALSSASMSTTTNLQPSSNPHWRAKKKATEVPIVASKQREVK
jgi:DNA-binding transcriptional LysR family regulator